MLIIIRDMKDGILTVAFGKVLGDIILYFILPILLFVIYVLAYALIKKFKGKK